MKVEDTHRRKTTGLFLGMAITAGFLMTFAVTATAFGAAAQKKTFTTAEEAVKAAVTAAKNNDDKELLAIFGSSAKDLLFSGDAVADKQRRARFMAAYDEKNGLVTEGESRVLVVGKQDWPFPIPLVKKGQSWVFDTEKGRMVLPAPKGPGIAALPPFSSG